MTARTYRIKIAQNGDVFEVEGDKAFVLKMLSQFQTRAIGEVSTQVSKQKGRSAPAGKSLVTKGKSLSIREFVQQLGFKRHTDITLAFGYYLEKMADTPEFTPADINNCYYEAKIEASNTSQMIIQNIRRGHMMQSKAKGDKGRKRYTVTASGEKFIEERLAGGS